MVLSLLFLTLSAAWGQPDSEEPTSAKFLAAVEGAPESGNGTFLCWHSSGETSFCTTEPTLTLELDAFARALIEAIDQHLASGVEVDQLPPLAYTPHGGNFRSVLVSDHNLHALFELADGEIIVVPVTQHAADTLSEH